METLGFSFVVMMPDPSDAKTCPGCGFDALLGFPVFTLSDSGVGSAGAVERCLRCNDFEEKP